MNILFNGILAVTTFLLMIIAHWQLTATNEAIKISDESLRVSRLDQRAWVGPTSFIHPGGGSKFFKEGSQPSFGVVITNTGKTPARKMRVMVGRLTLPKGVSFNASYDTGGATSTGILFPGMTATVTTNPEPHPLTAKQVEIITTGEFILYVYGVITYEDIFEVKHQSTFCGYLTTDLTSFKICSTYNDTD